MELVDPGSIPLVRLFRPDRQRDGDWEPPKPIYRKLRVDPPASHRDRFAVLYTADTLPCVAAECRILVADSDDHWTWHSDSAELYHVARYSLEGPAIFLPIDHPNADHLGLGRGRASFNSYLPFQEAALAVFERYGDVIHGLSWNSFHRNQLGRVYAIWHHHKTTVKLMVSLTKPYTKLNDDVE